MAATIDTIQENITTHLGSNLTKFRYELNCACVIGLLSFLIESTWTSTLLDFSDFRGGGVV